LFFYQEAELAREKTNGYKLDKSHIFAVNLLDDFEKYMKVPDTWTPAEIKPYTAGVSFFFLVLPGWLLLFSAQFF
jgi:hypothetical protein